MIETFLMVLPLFHVREHRETCDVLRWLEVLWAVLMFDVCLWLQCDVCMDVCVCVCVCVCVLGAVFMVDVPPRGAFARLES